MYLIELFTFVSMFFCPGARRLRWSAPPTTLVYFGWLSALSDGRYDRRRDAGSQRRWRWEQQ